MYRLLGRSGKSAEAGGSRWERHHSNDVFQSPKWNLTASISFQIPEVHGIPRKSGGQLRSHVNLPCNLGDLRYVAKLILFYRKSSQVWGGIQVISSIVSTSNGAQDSSLFADVLTASSEAYVLSSPLRNSIVRLTSVYLWGSPVYICRVLVRRYPASFGTRQTIHLLLAPCELSPLSCIATVSKLGDSSLTYF